MLKYIFNNMQILFQPGLDHRHSFACLRVIEHNIDRAALARDDGQRRRSSCC